MQRALVPVEAVDQVYPCLPPATDEVLIEVESNAKARIALRDVNDWPAVACPVWTEDQDFFGSGIATWTTDRVEIYLREG